MIHNMLSHAVRYLRVLRAGTYVCRRAIEEIRHEDLVLVLVVGVGDDIGALEGLVEEPEDIIDK